MNPEYLHLATQVAAGYARKVGYLADEIESAALVGLAVAWTQYDPSKGRFADCAVPYIRWAIQDCLRNWGPAGYRRHRAADAPDVMPLSDVADECVFHADELPVGWELESIDAVHALTKSLPQRQRGVIRHRYTRARYASWRAAGRKYGVAENGAQWIARQGLKELRRIHGC
jgi:DNA-directed RNA polymerase specialized sigma subunit